MRSLIFALLIVVSSLSATRTWNSTGSTDANDGNNYNPTGAILSTDSLVLNATSSIGWTLTGDLSIRGITVSSYTGALNTNGYDVTTVKRQYWNGTGSLDFTDSKLTITGDSSIIYINSFSSFTGLRCTVDVQGQRDTLYIVKTIASSPIQQYYYAYTGKTTYLYTPNTVVCYHNTHLKGGTALLLGRYWMVDPDTTHPYTVDGSGIWDNVGFQGPYLYHSNPSVHVFYMPRWWIGAHMTFRYAPTIATDDTVYFTDTLRAASIRFNGNPAVRQSIAMIIQGYSGITFFESYGSDSSYHALICGQGNNKPISIGYMSFLVPTRFSLYLNDCQNVISSGWNFSAGSYSYFLDAGTSTVSLRTRNFFTGLVNDSARFAGYPLYNVICTTSTFSQDSNAYMRFKDSLHCKGYLTLKGDVRFLNQFPMKVDGNFTDSLIDTCKLSSIYLKGNGYLSSLSKLSWYPNSILNAIGTTRQYVYSNGNSMPKVVIKKGAQLTVK